MDSNSVLKQVERYQKEKDQQERDNLLYQIAMSSNLFNARDVNQVADRYGELSEEQRQRVLGYIEVYFNLNLD